MTGQPNMTVASLRSLARERVGGLSKPSKMPGYGWSTPASECGMGSRLRQIDGSVCASCYALKGRYVFPQTQSVLHERLESWREAQRTGTVEAWAVIMARAIDGLCRGSADRVFRWFDSGDLDSWDQFVAICLIARMTPDVRHWLPSKEYGIAKRLAREIEAGTFDLPTNLVVRVSAPMKGSAFNGDLFAGVLPSSSVDAGGGHQCPASTQGNKCRDCRACWDPSVDRVDYPGH